VGIIWDPSFILIGKYQKFSVNHGIICKENAKVLKLFSKAVFHMKKDNISLIKLAD